MIYAVYIFNRRGKCLYHEEWNQIEKKEKKSMNELQEDERLLFGLAFSLKEFTQKMNSSTSPSTNWKQFQTNVYTCHQFETCSGLKFLIMTDKECTEMQPTLKYMYANIFVPDVMQNPLYDILKGGRIDNLLFTTHLQQYIQSLSSFN